MGSGVKPTSQWRLSPQALRSYLHEHSGEIVRLSCYYSYEAVAL